MPRQYTDEQLKNMTLEQAVAEVSHGAYIGSHLFERLEGKGKVHGNGHHIMQQVAAFAEKLMRERFIE